jgi:hypothetical protein
MALLGIGRKRLQHCHLRIGDRIGVVIAVDLTDVGLASFEIELLHLVERAFDEVNRLLVQRRRPARETRLADHIGAVGRIDDDEVVRRDRAKADGIRWI